VADHSKLEEAETARLAAQSPNDPAAQKNGLDAWRQAHPAPHATLSQVADHIDHIRKVAGIDHIGLGADFDGITTVIDGLEDVSKYPYLTAELLRRGYSDEDVKKIMGLNLLRAMRGAEQEARRLQASRPASTAVLPTSAP
jgi:membrane dipeptidase